MLFLEDCVTKGDLAVRRRHRQRTLVYLVDQACVTPHIWPSRAEKSEQPDQMSFDLDPIDGEGVLARKKAQGSSPSRLMTTPSSPKTSTSPWH